MFFLVAADVVVVVGIGVAHDPLLTVHLPGGLAGIHANFFSFRSWVRALANGFFFSNSFLDKI